MSHKKLKRKLEKKILKKCSRLVKEFFTDLYSTRTTLHAPIITGLYIPLGESDDDLVSPVKI